MLADEPARLNVLPERIDDAGALQPCEAGGITSVEVTGELGVLVEPGGRYLGSINAKGALCRRAPVDLSQYLLDDAGAGFGSRYL